MRIIMTDERKKSHWLRQARSLMFRNNLAMWFYPNLVILGVTSVLLSVVVLLLRKLDMGMTPVAFVWASVLVASGLYFWIKQRAKYDRIEDALARLDWAHRLNNQLTTAYAGHAPWPQPLKQHSRPVLRWHWGKLLLAPAMSMLVLALACIIPMRPALEANQGTMAKPDAIQDLEQWVKTIEEAGIVEEEAVQVLQEKIEALADKPQEQWYAENNLEAADHLRGQTQESISNLRKELSQINQKLMESRYMETQHLDAEAVQEWKSAMSKALENTTMGTLPLNREMVKQLQNIDPSQVKKLSPEQYKQLMQSLQKGMDAAKEVLKKGGEGKELPGMAILQEGQANSMPGDGGVSRGRGDAPMMLNNKEREPWGDKLDNTSNDDMSHAAMGELLGITSDKHEIDKNATKSTAGGDLATEGQGGSSVWKQQMRPDEEDVLKEYFK